MTDSVVGEQKLLSELRVTELKQELEKRNLDKNGIKIILTDRLEKALIADGHDPATYLFRVNEVVASPGSVKPQSPAVSPAPAMEHSAEEEKTKEITSENGHGTEAAESHDEAMDTESAEPAKNDENAADLDTSKELVIADEPAAGDTAAATNDEEMLEDPLIDVPTENAAPTAKSAVTVTSAAKTPVQAPVNDDKEKDIASRSIWVRGLTSATKAADLKVLCTEFGKVVRAKIYTSKKQTTSACYGYVTMADTAAAEKAAAALHKTQIRGRTISVEKADRSKVPAVKSASAAAPAKKDTANESSTSTKRDSDRKKEDDASRNAKATSVTSEKSHAKEGKKTESTSTQKRDDSRRSSDRKRDDRERRSTNAERRDSERPKTDSKRETFRRAPARDPRRDSQRTITAARRFPGSTRGVPSRGSLRGRITRPGDRTSSYMSIRRPEAMSQRDLLTLMRRKEEEHRRREAEIEKERALERERERIRFEREQLEKERLQLQLQAALQQQKLAAMSSSRTKDSYLPSSHTSSRARHDYRDSRDTRASKVSSSVHRRSAGDSRHATTDDRSRSRHVGASERSAPSRIERDRSDHKSAPASSRDRSRHESYSSARGHTSSQPAAYSRKEYDRGYTSSRDNATYSSGRGASSYYGAGYGSSTWQGSSSAVGGHSSGGSAWGGRGGTGSNGWSAFGNGTGASSGSSMRYDYDKYQQRY
ncbi:unnamed protein product [Cylicocyclus nassatus]|uniref:Scaffold attachment factor B2 n=1 Tax=Cylicocyclus nassatus TaxID=53992 RepID=A0AA36GPW1_CYLNA|nr:unnamed protein product [Cylicocyclus nassatus]